MGEPLIMVSSITYAMKGRELLKKNGFQTDLVRTPRKPNKEGCGYSLLVRKKVDEAEALLKKHGIPVIGRTNRDDKA